MHSQRNQSNGEGERQEENSSCERSDTIVERENRKDGESDTYTGRIKWGWISRSWSRMDGNENLLNARDSFPGTLLCEHRETGKQSANG
jgi:hypothetical protein